MISGLFRGLGKLALLAASAAFLVSISLLIGGSFLMTYPLLRKSPKNRRMQATMQMASAGMLLLSTLRSNANDDDVE